MVLFFSFFFSDLEIDIQKRLINSKYSLYLFAFFFKVVVEEVFAHFSAQHNSKKYLKNFSPVKKQKQREIEWVASGLVVT